MEKAECNSRASEEATADNVKKEKNGIWKKIDAFFERNYAILFAPLIVLFLYICALWRYDVYPFGSKYTAASYDLSAQICPFIEHIFDVVNGKSTLTYSYAIVGGADVTGTFLYFFISPFSFLFLILGEGRVAHASAIVMMCKLAVIAVAGAWFAKKLFKNIPDYLCIAVGVVYTYCGYTFVANTYINWLDFLIYLPFCAGAFGRFVKTGKFLPFSVLVAACIYTCFSIACFSMLTAYPVLIAYGLLCVQKEGRKAFLTKLSLAFVVAVLIALPVLLPAFMATTNSARTGGLFDNLWFGYKETNAEFVFDKKTFLDKLENSTYAKATYILTDSVFIVLTLVWFFRKGLKDKFTQFMLVAGVLTLLPVFVDESMLLLNMGSYYSYALRFGFLNALFFLGGACLCLDGVCFKRGHAYDGTSLYADEVVQDAKNDEKSENKGGRYALNQKTHSVSIEKNKKNKNVARWVTIIALSIVVFLGALVLAVTFIGADKLAPMSSSDYNAYVAKLVAKFPASWESTIKDICSKLRTMDGSFTHSLGNMEIISVVFTVVVVVSGLALLFVSLKKVSARMVSYLLLVVVGAQVLFYNGQLVIGNTSTQYVTLDLYSEAVSQLSEIDDGYYRIKDFGNGVKSDDGTKVNETLMGNAPFVAGSNSFSVFSSVIEDYNFITYPLFWYNGNATNSLKSLGRNKSFADSFLGYKYYWVPFKTDDVAEADKLSYLKQVYRTTEDGKQEKLVVGEKGNRYTLYENEIVFPNAYIVESGEFRFPNPNDKTTENRRANQKALYEFLGGEPYTINSASGVSPSTAQTRALSEKLHAQGVETEVGAGKITVKATAEKDGQCLFLSFVASRGYSVTVNGKKAKLIDNDLKFLSVELEEGENVVEFTYSSPYVKYAAVGLVFAVLSLVLIALLILKTRFFDALSPVIAWAGVLLAACVVTFFMIFPTGVCVTKFVELLRVAL